MDDNPKKINLGDPDNLPEQDRTSDSYLTNPGLKDEQVRRDEEADNKNSLWNEDPMEEKRAIEDTSEDRLSSAE